MFTAAPEIEYTRDRQTGRLKQALRMKRRKQKRRHIWYLVVNNYGSGGTLSIELRTYCGTAFYHSPTHEKSADELLVRPAGPERRQDAMIVYPRIPVVVLVRAFHGALPEANKFKGRLASSTANQQ